MKKLEDRREFLQPVMDNVSKEIKEYGMIKTFLPEATALERAVTYRDKKIKPLFIEMKNKIGAMAAQMKELTRERDSWKSKFQKKKQEHEKTKKELAEVQKTLWPKYKDNKDFRMIVIGREHTDEELTAYNKRKEFTFPLYPDPKREVTNKFASQYIPRSYLINKEGKVISATVGYQKEEMDKLMKEIDKALK